MCLFFINCLYFVKKSGWFGLFLKSIVFKLVSEWVTMKLKGCDNHDGCHQTMFQMPNSFKYKFWRFVIYDFCFRNPHFKRSEAYGERVGILIDLVIVHFGSFYKNAREAKYKEKFDWNKVREFNLLINKKDCIDENWIKFFSAKGHCE